jgi:hypothetical protein
LRRQQQSAARAIAGELETAYEAAGGWPRAAFWVAYTDALAAGAELEVSDQLGQLVRRPQTDS